MTRIALFIPLAACMVHAQTSPMGQQRPAPPLFTALDVNQDGVIDATELANAPVALKKLDKNGDGKLSPDEYRPQRPNGQGARGNENPNRQVGTSKMDGGSARISSGQGGPEDSSRGGGAGPRGDEQKPEGQPRSQGSEPQRPRPPIDLALDANGDEVIDAGEIANAAAALKKLDANGDGKLSREECLPKQALKQDGRGAPQR